MRKLPNVLTATLLAAAVAACTTDATPTPTATQTPAASPTATATGTPSPSATATSTAIPEPTPTPSPVPGAMAITLTPDADATLYDLGAQPAANGAGHSLFFGSTNGNEARRALVHFDVASALPQGAVIASARLVLTVTRSRAEPDQATLHRVTSSWGEGSADAETAGEGAGGEPDEGSATWVHRSFPNEMWGTPGGDYGAEPIASTLVLPPPRSRTVEVSWGSTSEMVADVQAWLDEHQTNFGWLIIGNEGTLQTAKRVASRENEDEAIQPKLLIEYFPPGGQRTVELTPSKDTTIYDDATLANGAGEWLFAGVTRQGAVRRALLAFDVAGKVPAGATIESVSFTLTVSQSSSNEQQVSVHEVLTAWSAGAADAEFNEGKGSPAQPGDATWQATGVGAERWDTPGGDHAEAAIVTAGVAAIGSTPTWGPAEELTALVQRWLDDPSSNHGFMLIGNESAGHTAKRFDSLDNLSGFPEPHPPVLAVTYTL